MTRSRVFLTNWKCNHTQSLVFEISSQSKLKLTKTSPLFQIVVVIFLFVLKSKKVNKIKWKQSQKCLTPRTSSVCSVKSDIQTTVTVNRMQSQWEMYLWTGNSDILSLRTVHNDCQRKREREFNRLLTRNNSQSRRIGKKSVFLIKSRPRWHSWGRIVATDNHTNSVRLQPFNTLHFYC